MARYGSCHTNNWKIYYDLPRSAIPIFQRFTSTYHTNISELPTVLYCTTFKGGLEGEPYHFVTKAYESELMERFRESFIKCNVRHFVFLGLASIAVVCWRESSNNSVLTGLIRFSWHTYILTIHVYSLCRNHVDLECIIFTCSTILCIEKLVIL